jgi:uncharacterized BrkB/YihY/UPF0761 family membrane protein
MSQIDAGVVRAWAVHFGGARPSLVVHKLFVLFCMFAELSLDVASIFMGTVSEEMPPIVVEFVDTVTAPAVGWC